MYNIFSVINVIYTRVYTNTIIFTTSYFYAVSDRITLKIIMNITSMLNVH